MFIVLFINFVGLNSLPIFNIPTAYPRNIINRDVSRISPSHCNWLATYCGTTNVENNDQQVLKIYGGQEAELGQMPWVVFVASTYIETINPFERIPIENRRRSMCSGTLISNSHVLTAAHCFFNKRFMFTSEDDFYIEYTTETFFKARVLTGAVELNSSNGRIHQEKARITFDYTSDYLRFSPDYAIIEIDPPLNDTEMAKTESTVRPACLPHYGHTPAINFQIAGWGLTNANLTSNILQTIVVYRENCDEIVRDLMTSGSELLCLCTNGKAGDGDSGTGYIEQINGHATVVAVHHGSLEYYATGRIGQDTATLLVPFDDKNHIPLQRILDHIWLNST